LRLVAAYADACNFRGGPDELRRKYRILESYCLEAGRAMSEIERTTTVVIPASFATRKWNVAQQFAKEIVEKIDAGAQHVLLAPRSRDLGRPIDYQDAIDWFTTNVVPITDSLLSSPRRQSRRRG
jgi:hypothetical protein